MKSEAMNPADELRAHGAEFRREVIEAAPGVFVAVGFAASNVGMLVGDDGNGDDNGVVIVDTTESVRAAENIRAEFRKIAAGTVRAILYTHGHRDHVSGAKVFAEAKTEIVARANFRRELTPPADGRPWPGAALLARARAQFGMDLSDDGGERISLGIGPGDRPVEGLGAGFVPPTRLVSAAREDAAFCGIKMSLLAAPGETDDHMAVWIPGRRVLFCGDNFYKSFPNLSPIRGGRFRDFHQWADSLDALIALDAEVLIPGHTRPLFGAKKIRAALSDYRDAIRALIRQCADGVNAGMGPDELAASVAPPPELAQKPHLREFYGAAAWAARGYFAGEIGWFDGNPTNLFPSRPKERAALLADAMGGTERVLNLAETALAESRPQWAAELCDILLRMDSGANHSGSSGAQAARRIKADALSQLAGMQVNACARNYYFSGAKQLREESRKELREQPRTKSPSA